MDIILQSEEPSSRWWMDLRGFENPGNGPIQIAEIEFYGETNPLNESLYFG